MEQYFIKNKYFNWYFAIIDSAKNRMIDGYTEKHHIIPKSMGGNNTKENIVLLTAREHFICHRLLVKMTTGEYKKKMLHAVWAFIRSSSNQERRRLTSRQYDQIRTQLSKMLSITRTGIWNKNRILSDEIRKKISDKGRGRKLSEETKAKMKESWKLRPKRSKEHCLALSLASKGRQVSNVTRKKMSDSHKGMRPVSTLTPFKCQHCGKEGRGLGNFYRWHGDNCKVKKHV